MSKKAEARQRVKAMREEQLRKERRRERTLRFGIAGAVLAAVVIIAVAVNASRGGDGATNLPGAVSEDDSGIVVGQADAPVTIDNWMDFLCPHCQEFEATNGEAIDELVASGDAKVVYHPVSYTGGEYSVRANNAFACAADEGKPNEFLKAAFESPAQWSDDDLVALGEEAGIGGSYAECVQDGTYDDWASSVLDAARDKEITGTPTLFIDGPAYDEPQVMDARTPDAIRSAVEAASAS